MGWPWLCGTGAYRAHSVHSGLATERRLRHREQVGLNKSEAKNALAHAVFFNRLGELRDRSFENQRYRASGLNLSSGRNRAMDHDLSAAGNTGAESAWATRGRRFAGTPLAA